MSDELNKIIELFKIGNDIISEATGIHQNLESLDLKEIYLALGKRFVYSDNQYNVKSYYVCVRKTNSSLLIQLNRRSNESKWKILNYFVESKNSSFLSREDHSPEAKYSLEEAEQIVLKHLAEIGYLYIGENKRNS